MQSEADDLSINNGCLHRCVNSSMLTVKALIKFA